MSVPAAIIYDRIVALESAYGSGDYVKALIEVVHACDPVMQHIEAYLEGDGWRRPA